MVHIKTERERERDVITAVCRVHLQAPADSMATGDGGYGRLGSRSRDQPQQQVRAINCFGIHIVTTTQTATAANSSLHPSRNTRHHHRLLQVCGIIHTAFFFRVSFPQQFLRLILVCTTAWCLLICNKCYLLSDCLLHADTIQPLAIPKGNKRCLCFPFLPLEALFRLHSIYLYVVMKTL